MEIDTNSTLSSTGEVGQLDNTNSIFSPKFNGATVNSGDIIRNHTRPLPNVPSESISELQHFNVIHPVGEEFFKLLIEEQNEFGLRMLMDGLMDGETENKDNLKTDLWSAIFGKSQELMPDVAENFVNRSVEAVYRWENNIQIGENLNELQMNGLAAEVGIAFYVNSGGVEDDKRRGAVGVGSPLGGSFFAPVGGAMADTGNTASGATLASGGGTTVGGGNPGVTT